MNENDSSIIMNDLIAEEFEKLMQKEDVCANEYEAYARLCLGADKVKNSGVRISRQLRFMWSKLREKKDPEFKKCVYDMQTTCYYLGQEAAKLAAECKRVLESDKE